MDLDELKEQWEDLEGWKKLLITLFFAGIIVYIIYMFLIEEKLLKKENLQSEIQKLKTDIENLKRYTKPDKLAFLNKKIQELQIEISKKQKELDEYKRYIPEKPFVEKVLTDISQIATKSYLELDSFSIRNKEIIYAIYDKNLNRVVFRKNPPKGYSGVVLKRINFNIKAKGSIKSLYSFLNKLSNIERTIIIDEVRVKKEKGTLKINIDFSSYYMED